MADDEENTERTAWVRIGYARTEDGRVDAGRIGTVEQLPYLEAKQMVRDGHAQFVDGPDAPAEAGAEGAPGAKELAEPLVSGAADPAAGFVRTRRNDPTVVRRMGAWGAAPVEKPDETVPAPVPVKLTEPAASTAAPAEPEPAPAEPAAADTAAVSDGVTATITTSEQE